jgi:hypothetical protein
MVMPTPIRTVAGFALLAGLSALHAQTPRSRQWWNDRPAGERVYATNAKTMPLISVKGNQFIDPRARIHGAGSLLHEDTRYKEVQRP